MLVCSLLIPFAVMAKEKKGLAEFVTKSHDFGNIREADGKVSYDFVFKNTGDESLVIISATTTCGCTKADYPKHPIAVGDSSVIKVTFDPKNNSGEFIKAITVKTPFQRIKLKITGAVVPKNSDR